MLEMMKASAKLPLNVKIWMGIMMLTFLLHIPYYDSPIHLANMLAFFLTAMIIAPIGFAMSKNVNSLAVAHFVAWPIMLAKGVFEYTNGRIDFGTTAGIILLAGYAIFAISLILDFKILMGELRKVSTASA